ncbi:vWA domain-containing protein [Arenibacterium sp. CAU 1754]
MMALGDITLLRPVWLLALPVLVALALILRRRRAVLGDWNKVVDPEMLRAMRALGRVDDGPSALHGMYPLLAAGIAVVGLAGPAVERRDAAAFRNLDGVVFVLDASPSVTTGDDWTAVQTMGRYAIASLGTRPGALVLFAGDAYVATDMTADLRQLGQTFSLISSETVPDPGTRPALGLALAAQVLDEADVLAGDVILIGDGKGLGPKALTQAADIAARGARLSMVVPDPNLPAVQTLVSTGQGRAFGLAESEKLARFLTESGRDRLELQQYPLLFWSDWGRYLLVFALLPILALFQRRQT